MSLAHDMKGESIKAKLHFCLRMFFGVPAHQAARLDENYTQDGVVVTARSVNISS
jgi:hypothetical protein